MDLNTYCFKGNGGTRVAIKCPPTRPQRNKTDKFFIK